jgi:hypothetical protein
MGLGNSWVKSLAKLLMSNPRKQPTFFFQLQPTLLAYCSLRNSKYNQEKMLVVHIDFFHG